MTAKVFNLFGHKDKPPEPEFDFTDGHFHLLGYCEEMQEATTVGQVKDLIKSMVEETKNWPDDG